MAQRLPDRVLEHLTTPRALVFPSEAMVPETREHLELRTALFLLLRDTFAETAWVGSEQFVYYDASDPSKVVAPDAFVRRGGPDERFNTWKVWERGAPELAVEIVSASDASASAWAKKLARYHAIGVLELVRFHPGAAAPLRVWDRVEDDLIERRVIDERVVSQVLGLDLVVADGVLRLSRDGVLIPTAEERAEQATGRAEQETERAAAADARSARLRAQLVAAGIEPEE